MSRSWPCGLYLSSARDPKLMGWTSGLHGGEHFLCHMNPSDSENACGSSLAQRSREDTLFVAGVDPGVGERVARDLQWEPILELLKDLELIEEIYAGHPSVRGDWPWACRDREPFDTTRDDWWICYAAVFQLNDGE
jgi:hypothetical protein